MLFFYAFGSYNNYRRRRETKSHVLLWTLELEGAELRKCVKTKIKKKEKFNACIFWNKTLVIGDVIFIDYPLKYYELL